MRGKAATRAGLLAAVMTVCIAPAPVDAQVPQPPLSPISADRVDDAIAGGWAGSAIAAAWGYPVEFDFNGRLVPQKQMRFRPKFVNKFNFGGGNRSAADDVYVDVALMDAFRIFGVRADWTQIGQPLAASRFLTFFANGIGRTNLRAGILPPLSGHPAVNRHSDDIDFQIEANWIGMMAPGQPGAAAELAWRDGHIMNYGDGVYGGVMVAAMQSAAFRAGSVGEIVAAGQAAVPEGTAYRRMIDDVIGWHRANPGNWRATWNLLQRNWSGESHPHPGENPGFNISAILNGGYVLLGLLYGGGNFARTVKITIRAGQDTDSNANNTGSIIGQWLGARRIPARFKTLTLKVPISGTDYTLADAISVNRELAAQVTKLRGGVADGPVWQLPADVLVPPSFEQLVPGDSPPAIGNVNAEVTGKSARFRLDAGPGIRDTYWSFGDLSAARGQDVSHAYREPGTYRVNLWVANAGGTTAHRELTVTIP